MSNIYYHLTINELSVTNFNSTYMSCTLLAHQEETRRVDAFMQLPMVRNVLSTGVDRNLVRYAIEGMLRETGTGVLYKDLINITLIMI